MARRAGGGVERRWRERLRRHHRSGLTVVEFCAREGISTASFYSWRRRLEPSPRPGAVSPEGPLFVPVSIHSAAAGLRIEFPGGAVVELPRDADERLVWTCLRAAAELGRAPEESRC